MSFHRTSHFSMKEKALIWTGCLAILLCFGCVQAQSRPDRPKPAKLMISRGVNGVNMQWKGEVGTTYTLYYKDTVGTDTSWKIVPRYQHIQGRGELIEFRDTAPTAKSRRYRVHTVEVSP